MTVHDATAGEGFNDRIRHTLAGVFEPYQPPTWPTSTSMKAASAGRSVSSLAKSSAEHAKGERRPNPAGQGSIPLATASLSTALNRPRAEGDGRRLARDRAASGYRPPPTKRSWTMLGVFAEFETNLRQERRLEGIKSAKGRGTYKGP